MAENVFENMPTSCNSSLFAHLELKEWLDSEKVSLFFIPSREAFRSWNSP